MSATEVEIKCPHCERSYKVKLNLQRLMHVRSKAVCARCQKSFDVASSVLGDPMGTKALPAEQTVTKLKEKATRKSSSSNVSATKSRARSSSPAKNSSSPAKTKTGAPHFVNPKELVESKAGAVETITAALRGVAENHEPQKAESKLELVDKDFIEAAKAKLQIESTPPPETSAATAAPLAPQEEPPTDPAMGALPENNATPKRGTGSAHESFASALSRWFDSTVDVDNNLAEFPIEDLESIPPEASIAAKGKPAPAPPPLPLKTAMNDISTRITARPPAGSDTFEFIETGEVIHGASAPNHSIAAAERKPVPLPKTWLELADPGLDSVPAILTDSAKALEALLASDGT